MKSCFRHLFSFTLLLCLFPFTTGLFAQSGNMKPEKVYRIVYAQKPNKWYIQQEKLWKKELERNPQNAQAWYNYYNAVRYARYSHTIDTGDKQAKLKQIIEEMGKAIPNTYEYHLLKYWNNFSLTDISDLEKAYRLRPDAPDTYYGFISHYDHTGQSDKMKEFLQRLYYSADIAPTLLNYNYNVLMSCGKNAILFTNGDNDTYPAWMLQHVKAIRTDVTVLNVHLIMTGKDYLGRKLKEKGINLDYDALPKYRSEEFVAGFCKYINEKYPRIPIFFALTVSEHYTKTLKDDLFIVGLAYQYSRERIDNLALLKKNFEKKFRLDYLNNEWYIERYPGMETFSFLRMNYVVPMLMLAEHYKLSGEAERAEYYKQMAVGLGRKAGREKEIDSYLKEKGW